MDGLGSALGDFFQGIFVLLIVCFILAIFGVGYAVYSWFFKEETVITSKKIVPEMKLIIKDNKVDTLWIYKQVK